MFCQRLFLFFSKKFHTWYMHGITCYCPTGLLPHFYENLAWDNGDRGPLSVNALSGCYLISTFRKSDDLGGYTTGVNALSGCYIISTMACWFSLLEGQKVSMPSRAVTSFLLDSIESNDVTFLLVSMPSRAVTSFLQDRRTWLDIHRTRCQCPLGLLPHFYL